MGFASRWFMSNQFFCTFGSGVHCVYHATGLACGASDWNLNLQISSPEGTPGLNQLRIFTWVLMLCKFRQQACCVSGTVGCRSIGQSSSWKVKLGQPPTQKIPSQYQQICICWFICQLVCRSQWVGKWGGQVLKSVYQQVNEWIWSVVSQAQVTVPCGVKWVSGCASVC
jgi:hypothetical protein